MGLDKIEVVINPTCRNVLTNLQIAGNPRSASYAEEVDPNSGVTYTVLKVREALVVEGCCLALCTWAAIHLEVVCNSASLHLGIVACNPAFMPDLTLPCILVILLLQFTQLNMNITAVGAGASICFNLPATNPACSSPSSFFASPVSPCLAQPVL
jgi:hypothetical protein